MSAPGSTESPRRGVVAPLIILAVAAIATGALLGVLWWRLTPRVDLFVADGKGYPQGFQPEGYMSADGIAAVLCAVAGLVFGVAIVLLARRWSEDPPSRVYLALLSSIGAGLLGSAALWLTGDLLDTTDLAAQLAVAQEGDTVIAPLRMRIPAALLLWPMASVAVVFVVAVFSWSSARAGAAADQAADDVDHAHGAADIADRAADGGVARLEES